MGKKIKGRFLLLDLLDKLNPNTKYEDWPKPISSHGHIENTYRHMSDKELWDYVSANPGDEAAQAEIIRRANLNDAWEE